MHELFELTDEQLEKLDEEIYAERLRRLKTEAQARGLDQVALRLADEGRFPRDKWGREYDIRKVPDRFN